jgi:hypothetical protein
MKKQIGPTFRARFSLIPANKKADTKRPAIKYHYITKRQKKGLFNARTAKINKKNVIPAKAGIHCPARLMDASLRWHDGIEHALATLGMAYI